MRRKKFLIAIVAATLTVALTTCFHTITEGPCSLCDYYLENKLDRDINIKYYELDCADENGLRDTTATDSIIRIVYEADVKAGETGLIVSNWEGFECEPEHYRHVHMAVITMGDSTITHKFIGLPNFSDRSIYREVDRSPIRSGRDRTTHYTYLVTIDEEFLKNHPDNSNE